MIKILKGIFTFVLGFVLLNVSGFILYFGIKALKPLKEIITQICLISILIILTLFASYLIGDIVLASIQELKDWRKRRKE